MGVWVGVEGAGSWLVVGAVIGAGGQVQAVKASGNSPAPKRGDVVCTGCSHVCQSRSDLLRHMRTHTQVEVFPGLLACALCASCCPPVASLVETWQEKPFKCEYCEYRCVDKPTLIIHERIHTGDRPFKCAHCDYRSYKKSLVTVRGC